MFAAHPHLKPFWESEESTTPTTANTRNKHCLEMKHCLKENRSLEVKNRLEMKHYLKKWNERVTLCPRVNVIEI